MLRTRPNGQMYLHLFTIGILIGFTIGFVLQLQQSNSRLMTPSAYGAGSLTNVFALPSINIFYTKSYYTIAFTTATTATIKTVEIPPGFNIGSAKLIEAQGIGSGSLSVSRQILIYTVSTPVSVPPPRTIKIMISDVSNAAITSNQVSVVTKDISINAVVIDGPTSSAPFTLTQVTNPMIGLNAVGGSKIVDGSVGKTDVSTAFVKKVTLSYSPAVLGGYGWDPGNPSTPDKFRFVIPDSQVTENSILEISVVGGVTLYHNCWVSGTFTGYFSVTCARSEILSHDTKLNYVIIN